MNRFRAGPGVSYRYYCYCAVGTSFIMHHRRRQLIIRGEAEGAVTTREYEVEEVEEVKVGKNFKEEQVMSDV